MRATRDTGWLLLGIWLLATGLLPLLRVQMPAQDTLLQLLAAVAGALIVWGR